MRNGRLGFVVAGVQKAGTSALFTYLTRHPSLLPPRRKEIHFFDDETGVDWISPDYERLHSFFPSDDSERIAFEATPISIFWPNALERIAEYNPEIQIILIFRDPIERAWSHWRMEMSRGADNVPFSYAIRNGRARLNGFARNHPAWRTYSYVERGLYGAQISNLLRLFHPSKVLLLRSNDLKRDPAGVLALIARFLQISPFPIKEEIAEHVGGGAYVPPSKEDIAYLRDFYQNDMELFVDTACVNVADWPTYWR
ncbi:MULTISPECIES: sulfotransferase domain-containing protein [unclassified Mesorhizobium]|uniref:sulfotransferase domain-containing protein n=1 Tax=unclassified Mesorhizobium TaxID=325217 RepID=UPI000F754282|nr:MULTISPECIES: sulfotransferase domain-containing protein [unclassified Mesorhizobium]AZO06018.1 sulfotransferase [Mesorhizobium sp. M2A.F.Ca.ET.043.02.1.1]RUW41885.1 sulfotransferase [Mesorhizobium sp. M2A.F.Ca.ET.015.02.1.1]RUW78981.1 sulfotransferase [Mesorhizobium sp. M2A.F.Ca.ET.067.02.1.1]RVD08083.1 sulfotransferase [Mesorhizobium sp. M2A.F.Ca.ET.029.05.1.1]RWB44197.1 MAG: sulfotransferase [Mesorhizobium sp.]